MPAARSDGFPIEAFDRLATLEDGHYWFEARNRLILWAIERYLPAMRSFLEIGCGTGFVLRGIHRAFPHVELFGTDLHEAGLRWARTRVPAATLRQAEASDLPATPRYDAVGLFDVLEHIEHDQPVLDRAFAAIRPGGGLLVSGPQHPFLWGRADEYAQHVRRYSARVLTERVERAGFEIVRTTGFVTLLLPLMILSRLVDRARPDRFDPWREFRVSRATNAGLRTALDIERLLIRCGVSFPAGGSLLVIARRPELTAADGKVPPR